MEQLAKMNEFFALRTEYSVKQINGQRIVGPSGNWSFGEPKTGSEICIKNIPPNFFEYDIFSIFSAVGRIYELRVMITHAGSLKGMAFIKYLSEAEAELAVRGYKKLDSEVQKVIVQFQSHREAAIARRELVRQKMKIRSKTIYVSWAGAHDTYQLTPIRYARNLKENIPQNQDVLKKEIDILWEKNYPWMENQDSIICGYKTILDKLEKHLALD